MRFFMPMIPPTATAQEKQSTIKNGKVYYYDPPQVKEARAKLISHLVEHIPEKPLDGPLRCMVKWLFPITAGHESGEYKWTAPDTHNLNKLLFDVMAKLGFWVNDARVASEIIEKFWNYPIGIYIHIEELGKCNGFVNLDLLLCEILQKHKVPIPEVEAHLKRLILNKNKEVEK